MDDPQLFYADVRRSLALSLPLLIAIAGGLGVLVADVLLPRARRTMLAPIAAVALIAAFLGLLGVGAGGEAIRTGWSGALRFDGFTFLAQGVILASMIFVVLISPRWLEGRRIALGEYYALLVLGAAAMMALAASTELLTLFLNFELVSITFYVLVGMEQRNLRSSEAGFKYFLLGSIAAAFLLFGLVLVFGATGGETRYADIAAVLAAGNAQPVLMAVGIGLMAIGFCFKLTLAPFHMYAPDVYQGAPTPVAAAIATGSKVAGMAALMHFIQAVAGWAPGVPHGVWVAFYAIVVASVVIGNFGAIIQPDLKRMLAYSSIAHSGYMLIPMVVVVARPALMENARLAVAYYMMAYSAMTLLAFGVMSSLGSAREGAIGAWAGMWRRAPWRAGAMTLAMISLIGIPPTVGFIGKVMLFGVAVAGDHLWLAIVGVLASVASVSYYLRVVVTMFMHEPAEGAEAPPALDGINWLALSAATVGVILFAIYPFFYLLGD